MNKSVHFLVWRRFAMACGKRPAEVWTSASFWDQVTCKACLEARTTQMADVEA